MVTAKSGNGKAAAAVSAETVLTVDGLYFTLQSLDDVT